MCGVQALLWPKMMASKDCISPLTSPPTSPLTPHLSPLTCRLCWKMMVFKDLVGYPLWETQLHDVLQASFADLHKIFTYYCGASIQGSASIAAATRIGVMEFLALAKDTCAPPPIAHHSPACSMRMRMCMQKHMHMLRPRTATVLVCARVRDAVLAAGRWP